MSYNIETKMYEGYIYCIENLINGKKYIGYTKNDIDTRWCQHLSKTHHKEDNSILHLAIDKYGEENFNVYSIHTVKEKSFDKMMQRLKEMERKYIKEYNTLTPNGYNILTGGENVPINRITSVHQYTMDGEYICSFNSITEAIQLNGFDDNPRSSKLGRCLNTNHCAFGYLWSKCVDEDVKQLYVEYNQNRYKRQNKKQRVVQLDSNMSVINIYESTIDASNKTGLNKGSIYSACSPKYKSHYTCGGYIWMFEENYNASMI